MTDQCNSAGPPETRREEEKSLWPWDHIAIAFLIGFVTQMAFLQCACSIGIAKMRFALWVDALVLLRVLASWVLRERNDGWKFYALLLYTSAGWISALAWILGVRH